MSTTTVSAAIDSGLKIEAAEVLKTMGLSVSDAIRLMLQSVASSKALPAGLAQPNAVTQQAMLETLQGVGLETTSLDALAGNWDCA
jgi:DNA-damage-inducible protein J